MAIFKGTPTKDGRMYYFRKSKNGEQYNSKKYLTKEECEKAESKFILKNDDPINKRFDIVAEEYLEDIKKKRKESTFYSYRLDYKRNIYPYFKNSYINQLAIKDIKKWYEIIDNKNICLKYKNNLYSIFKGIYDYAIKNYNIEKNLIYQLGRFQAKQTAIIKDEEKLRYIIKEQFDTFIKVVDIPVWHCFFTTLYYTGARKGEVQALTWNDINWSNKEISINKTLSIKTDLDYIITPTKTYKNRKIKMSKTLYEELYSYYLNQKSYTDFRENWFVFNGTTYLKSTTIDRYKHNYFELSGVPEITIHEFRHSHVSLLINEYLKSGQTDTSKFFVMMSNRMGHTIGVMQKTYMHLFPSVQDEIVDLLDNL